MNKVILLYKRPVGKPVLSDFKFAIEEVPVATNGELLLKTLYVSVDPYLRGRMNDSKSYVPPFQLNKPIQSGIVAEVIGSNRTDFKIGDFVSGNLEWKEYQISDGKGLNKINDNAENLSKYLGILGMTGLTAYCGLTEIGTPKEGETIVVSGAAGAVGSVVGQIGKILGCRVVGITGTEEKVDLLKSKFHFDQAINYKTAANLKEAIGNACPAGVDVYFDNVGGEISDAVLANINKYARIPLCGAISLYNETKPPIGPRIQPVLLVKSSMMRGFIVSDFSDKFPGAIKQLASWLKEGKLTYAETIVEGFDHIPQAFLDLFEGKNEGKMIVKIQYKLIMKVLIVLTSHSELGNTGEKTGFWIEEFAAPYYVMADAGVELTIASPKGGQPPIDPKSEAPGAETPATLRFNNDQALKDKLAHTIKLSNVAQVDYDAVFYPGGHGPLWDLANNETSIALIENFYKHNKPVAFVCHAPGALIKVKAPNGEPLVKGKAITGFSNTEEEAVKLTAVVPFLLEDELGKLGGIYTKGPDWSVYVKKDGLLITGQNPASSEEVAKLLLATLKEKNNGI